MGVVVPDGTLHPLTLERYHRMIETGILGEDDRVELLDGVLFEVSPEGPPHRVIAERLNKWLVRGIDDPALGVGVGSPLSLPPASEPEPDFSVVNIADRDFSRHPSWAHLVVEVSRSSRARDRGRKARIYARAGIPEYWIVDLVKWCVEVRRDPAGDAFRSCEVHRSPARIRPQLNAAPALDLTALFAADG